MTDRGNYDPVEELDSDKDLWEQQQAESAPAFEAFAVYRDAGPARSTRAAARQVGKNAKLISRWCKKWRWVERVRAWDQDQDRQRRQQAVEALAEMHQRHAKLAAVMTAKIATKLNSVKAEDLTAAQVAQWLDIAVKIERVARGDVSDRAGVEHSGPGGDPLTVQVAEFAKMDPEQRRAAAARLAEEVHRRTQAAAGASDGHDDDGGAGPGEGP